MPAGELVATAPPLREIALLPALYAPAILFRDVVDNAFKTSTRVSEPPTVVSKA